MTENIRVIFEQNIKLLGDMDKAVIYSREQQYDKALGLLADSMDRVKGIIEAIITDQEYFNLVDTEALLEMLTGILEANKNKDFILLADYLELQLISFLIGVQELIISKEEILFNEENYRDNIGLLLKHGNGFPKELTEPINTSRLLEDGYRIEFTSCGLMTLAAEDESAKFYFHTNNRIQSEAFQLARHWYREDKKRYILYGFGMGYHVKELLNLAGEAEIEIYEADLNVVQLACAFTDLKDILSGNRVKVYYDPQFLMLESKITVLTPEEILIVHYPSWKNIRSEKGKAILHNVFPWSKAIGAS